LIGVESEIVKRAVANCIRVLISRKSFCAPCNRGWVGGINIPWCAAIPGISLRAVMRKAGMLRRRMKSDVSDIDASSYGHGERLNPAIEVLVIERVLIVPHAAAQVGYFVTHEPDTIGTRSRFDLIYCRTCPCLNSGLLPHRRSNLRKREIGGAANAVLTVGSVVVHVALPRMTLTPSVFVRGDILRFGKIGRSRV
jgi:hypothetical protein